MDKVKYIKDSIEIKQKILSDKDFLLQIDNVAEKIIKCYETDNKVLIAGNGDFNVKHYNGEFNAYQRTYVLIPSDSLYYGTLYMSALKLVQKFRKASSGSIVKFISKEN